MILETVKVIPKGTDGEVTINKSDYDPEKHELIREKLSVSSPVKVDASKPDPVAALKALPVGEAAKMAESAETLEALADLEVAELAGSERKAVLRAIAKRREELK